MLYAAEHIPAGSIIATHRGEVISEAKRAAREETLGFGSQTYAMQQPDSMEPLYVVDARSTGRLGRFINHACGASANCALEALQLHHRRVMAFRASRDIAKDEPIRLKQNESFNETEPLLALSHRMRYGHPRCIGTSHLSR